MWHTRITNTVYDVDEGSWDKVSGGHPQLSHAWQRVLEAAAPSYKPTYILLFDDADLAAWAICPGVQSWQLSHPWARWLLDASTLLVSLPSSTLYAGLAVRDDERADLALDKLLEALQDAGRRRRRLFHAITNVNPLLSPSPEQLTLRGFLARPLMDSLYLANRWTRFEDYGKSLGKKHNYEIRSYQRKARALGVTVTRKRQFDGHGDTLYRLLLNVHQRHYPPHAPPLIGSDFFEILQRERPPGTELILVEVNDQIVAFVLCQAGDGLMYIGPLVGLDYEKSRKTYAYFLLYYEVIGAAIEYGCRGVYAGVGTVDIKSRLGFERVPRYLCLRGTHAWLDRPLSWLLKDRTGMRE
jgi:predicted N-acyltransferase